MNSSLGAMWRRWDLHFHTPSSFDYQDKSVTNELIIKTLRDMNISAVAITDHHSIDTVRIKELQKLSDGEITIFPGIELRSELGGSESIHFIGIFPDNCDIESIWTKLQGKLNLTQSDIEQRGNDKVYCHFKEASNYIHELGGIITIHAGSKTNTVENITNALPYKEAIKEDIVDVVDIYEVGQLSDIQDYRDKVFPNINKVLPLVLCSDNHKIGKYSPKTSLWIKADTTFQGLLQVLNEPDGRVFVGERPSVFERVDKNRTKYIKSISINKDTASIYDEEVWFKDIQIDINPELVAIIGNKGNGKSALADILGLVGNSQTFEHFSFLNSDKFRNSKNNKAKHFIGSIEWFNGDVESKLLSDNPNTFDYEKIKYIPQKYLEVLCNEERDEFEGELEDVIFSHVPIEERLGKTSLREYVQYRGELIENRIKDLERVLADLNNDILNIEEQADAEFRKTLEEQLKVKKQELEAHLVTKPKEIKKPETDESIEKQTKEITADLENCVAEKNKLEQSIAELQKERAECKKKLVVIDRIIGEVKNHYALYDGLVKRIEPELKVLGLNYKDVLTIEYNSAILEKSKTEINDKIASIDAQVDHTKPESLTTSLQKIALKIADLNGRLDEPNKKYQGYLKGVQEWEQRRKELIGHKETEGTIEYLTHRIQFVLTELPKEISRLKQSRWETANEIYKGKVELISIYKELYKPVESFFLGYESDKYPVKFDVTLELENFTNRFFDFINQKTKGSFCGVEDGQRVLRGIIEKTDFNNPESVQVFLDDVIVHLENDLRYEKKEPRKLVNQIKKDVSEFFNFLFSLDYIVPRYTLKLGDIELSQLSPGEKGALLLIFYLLIDKNDIPLIIDQPEENLDNQSVYELLVKYIKMAKNRRQIIIVTHNPNLAVVCDAEQIIYAKIDKADRNTISYTSGSIENPTINKTVVDVLEGTMPAFNNREAKYSTNITRADS